MAKNKGLKGLYLNFTENLSKALLGIGIIAQESDFFSNSNRKYQNYGAAAWSILDLADAAIYILIFWPFFRQPEYRPIIQEKHIIFCKNDTQSL